MRKIISTIVLTFGLTIAGSPAALANTPPPPVPEGPAPAMCQPWIDVLDWQIRDRWEQGQLMIRTENELFATISDQRDHIARLHDRLQTRRWKIRQQARDLRRQAAEIRHLRAQLAEAQH